MPVRIAVLAGKYAEVLCVAAVLAGLCLANLFSHLLFSNLAEALTILLALNIFIFTWNTRRFQEDAFLALIGFGALCSAALLMVHALSSGVSMFSSYGINISPQLFLASQAVWSVSLLAAPFLINRAVNNAWIAAAYAVVTGSLFAAVFLRLLPESYADNGDPTRFMNVSAAIVALIYQASIVNLLRDTRAFPSRVHALLTASLTAAAVAALMAGGDPRFLAPLNFGLHILKLLSTYLLYRAIMLAGFDQPHKQQDSLLRQKEEEQGEREAMLNAVDQLRVVAEQRADELAAIFSTLSEPVVIYNTKGEIVRVNRAAYSQQGFDPFIMDPAGKQTSLLMMNRDGSPLAPGRQPAARALEGETIVSDSLIICDIQGRDVIGHVSAAPFSSNGTLRGAIVAWHDITELERIKTALQQAHDELEKRVLERTGELATANLMLQSEIEDRTVAEEDLLQSRQQLRELSLHLQAVLEQERENIAREIHDELGQSLTALKLDLSWLNSKYQDHGEISRKVGSMTQLIGMTLTTVKRISSELRPAILDHLGLAAAVIWQMKEFDSRSGIASELIIRPEDLAVGRDRSTALFRILQESLTNVIRHARATKVWVALEEAGGHLTLQVKDNGVGLAEEQGIDHRAFGLIGIRERVLFFNGEVTIAGKPYEGTTIKVRIPVDDTAAV